MTEKEFRKLRPLDLIQILLTQNNEEARIQEELDRQKEYLDGLRTHNENLKTLLNDKDALIETLKQDLNQSDNRIRDLREELKTLYADKRINLENIGSLTEVAKRVNQIFETAQREAEQCLAHLEHAFAIGENTSPGNITLEGTERPEPDVNESETTDHTIPEALIPKASPPYTGTVSSEAETSEDTEPHEKDVTTAKTEDEKAEPAMPNPADSCDIDAAMEKGASADTDTTENVTPETPPETTAVAKHIESHHSKAPQTHSRQNEGLFRKLLGGMKRKNGGK